MTRAERAVLNHSLRMISDMMGEDTNITIQSLLLVLSSIAGEAGIPIADVCDELTTVHRDMSASRAHCNQIAFNFTGEPRKPAKRKPAPVIAIADDSDEQVN
jgi:hypothetical protein